MRSGELLYRKFVKFTSMKHESKVVDFKLLQVSSPAFQDGEYIPAKYTCKGSNVSPPLDIAGIPESAVCLAIVVEDPDAPAGTWVHWVAWNIPVTHHWKENQLHGKAGINDFRQNRYIGPCPPPGKPHRYFFKLYALDQQLSLPVQSGKARLERAMSEHILGFGELKGLFAVGNHGRSETDD